MVDASAFLAAVRRETGGSAVADVLHRSAISSVNWVEVAQHPVSRSAAVGLSRLVVESGLAIVPLDRSQAEDAAALRAVTRELGFSLADRACLALARSLGVAAMTTDRAWAKLDVGVEIEVIR